MLLFLAACLPPSPDDTGDTSADTSADTSDTSDTGAPDELAANRALWEANGPAAYTYVLQWQCFCPEEYTGPARISVEGGAVVASTYVSTGEPTSVFDARTIDGLFDFLAAAYARGADQVTVTYDEALGHPTQAYADYDLGADDEEMGFVVTELTAAR